MAGLVAAAAALAGCTQPENGQWREPEADGSPSASPSASPSVSPSPTAPPETTLAFGGDVHFPAEDGGVPNRTGALLAQPQTAFGPVAEVFSAADVSMVNLETAVTTDGAPVDKAFTFRAPPAAYEAVRAADIDVVSLANNHALDHGREGLADTLRHAEEAGVPAVGAGEDAAAAYAPWVTEVHGVEIAYLGLNQVHALWQSWRAGDDRAGLAYAMDSERALGAVRDAAEGADVVVVYMHWGREGDDCPTGEMQSFAQELADAGADLVVGTHAHMLLGDGWHDDTFVQYGLGNFLWWRDEAFSNDTGVLWVTLRGSEIASVELRPAVISEETGQPIPVEGDEAERILGAYADLRECTGLADAPE